MSKTKQKIWLQTLYLLVYLKKILFKIFFFFGLFFFKFFSFFNKIIGFRIYRIFFYFGRFLKKHKLPKDNRIIEIIGKREILQIILLLILIFISLPQTKIYGKNLDSGKQTMLFKLIGPGEEYFFEEVTINYSDLTPTNSPDWKEGTISANPVFNEPTTGDITGLSMNGTAVIKPNIIPGAVMPNGQTTRKEIIYYEVQTGDTISSIAERYSVSISTLLWSNNLTARSYIRPGDKLTILPTSGLMHKVSRGDTISKIAKIYNSTEKDIIEYNKLKSDGSDIVIGEQLIIPNGVKPAPKPVYIPPRPLGNVSAPPPSSQTATEAGYIWPTAARRISQYYGWRHTGLDIAGPVGTAVYATKAGKVIKAGWNKGGYGNYVIIDHGGGVQTLYGHASKLFVSAGESVAQGQTIMAMGSTGRSTGSHLHFEIRVNGGFNNPLKYVR